MRETLLHLLQHIADSKEQLKRRRRNNSRGFLHKCQPPACQGSPVATTDRSGRTQCQAKKTGDNEQTTAWATRMKKEDDSTFFRNVWGQKGAGALGVKKSIYTIKHVQKQREGPGLVRAFVLDGTNHDASVVTAEKVVITRQEARALPVSFGILRKRGGIGATPASSKPRRVSFTCGEYVNHVYKDPSCPH